MTAAKAARRSFRHYRAIFPQIVISYRTIYREITGDRPELVFLTL